MHISGDLLIGQTDVARADRFFAYDPSAGAPIAVPGFAAATRADVAQACASAEAAFPAYAALPLSRRAAFLDAAADAIDGIGQHLTARAMRETGLPPQRLEAERARTVAQLRLFAAEVRDGGWQSLRIERGDPSRQPAPRPDLRLRRVPIGPVAVFGASNFPLAFSVGGGDTAAALAAGCPVVVKAHAAHPGTSELVGRAIRDAAAATGMPDGVFSLLHHPGHEAGLWLVSDPRIRAVGFTGSRSGGIALMRAAAARKAPIPVYAEMASINPVVLLPAALRARPERLAEQFVASLSTGAGQLCTKPGLVLAIAGDGLAAFVARAGAVLETVAAHVMLGRGIHQAFETGKARLAGAPGIVELAQGCAATGPNQGQAALFCLDARTVAADPRHAQEIFGAVSVIVRCDDMAELRQVVDGLEGQLAITLHGEEDDHAAAAALVPLLERKAGRIVWNSWPTGVEVSHAMVHGGPYPATSDGRSTSVGTLAIERFLRPIAYQSMPEALLPPALRGSGDGLVRVDGAWRLPDAGPG